MWLIPIWRQRPPDVPYWRGRRTLSVVDAVAWPVLLMLAFAGAPFDARLFGTMIYTTAAIAMVLRVRTAIWRNGRYRFTTWRVARVVATLLLIGLVARMMV